MINEEITNLNDRDNIFEMSYESRALDTDVLDAPPGHVITGKKKLIVTTLCRLPLGSVGKNYFL